MTDKITVDVSSITELTKKLNESDILKDLIKKEDVEFVMNEMINNTKIGKIEGQFDMNYTLNYLNNKQKKGAPFFFYGFSEGKRTLDTLKVYEKKDGKELNFKIAVSDLQKARIVKMHARGTARGGKIRQWMGLNKMQKKYLKQIAEQRYREILLRKLKENA